MGGGGLPGSTAFFFIEFSNIYTLQCSQLTNFDKLFAKASTIICFYKKSKNLTDDSEKKILLMIQKKKSY